MRIQIFLNDEDYIAYNIAFQFQTPQGRKAVTINRWLTPVLSILMLLIFWLADFKSYLLISEAVVLTGLSIYSVLTTEKRIKKRIRSQIGQMKTQGELPYENEAMLEVMEDALMEYTPSTTKRIAWSEITQLLYDEEHIFLMFSAIQAAIVPYRCLGPMREPFIAYVRQRTGL